MSYQKTEQKLKGVPGEKRRNLVQIVVPPFMSVFRPSLGASLLKACLSATGFKSRVYYLNIEYSRRAGDLLSQYVVKHSPKSLLVGEWIFSVALFPNRDPLLDAEFEKLLFKKVPNELVHSIMRERERTPEYTRSAAAQLVSEKPAIIGFSSMFQTHCAALAIAKEVKKLDPKVMICFGGANCEGVMGWGTLKSFPQVDYVFSGNADFSFPEFVRRFFARERPLAHTSSIFSREDKVVVEPEIHDVDNLNSLPIPEYDDYFNALDKFGYLNEFEVGLLVETSRGCWWGEKHHCKFCGLNGVRTKFNSKSPERVLSEFKQLAEKWNPDFFHVSDNIMDLKHINVFNELHRLGRPYRFYCEVKSNMTAKQLRKIAMGGVTWIQAGIESLNDEILALMNKGVSALQNICFLRNCVEIGLIPHWNILTGIPNETPEQYEKMTRMVRYLEHLPPPIDCNAIRLVRFSPYFEQSKDYGYEGIMPAPSYRYIYGIEPEAIEQIAYLFIGTNKKVENGESVQALKNAVLNWQSLYKKGVKFPRLMIFTLNHARLVKDTRAVSKQLWRSVSSLEILIIEAFRSPARVSHVMGNLKSEYRTHYNDMESALKRLVDWGYILIDGEQALSLVVDPSRRVQESSGSESEPQRLGEQIEYEIQQYIKCRELPVN